MHPTKITTAADNFKAAKSKSSWFNKTLAFSLLSFVLGAGIAVPATSSYMTAQFKKASAAKVAPVKKITAKPPVKVDLSKPPVQNVQTVNPTSSTAVSSVAK
jgi:hypothetical protein